MTFCRVCWEANQVQNPLVYDHQALVTVCEDCGYVDPHGTELQATGRSMDEDAPALGRSTINAHLGKDIKVNARIGTAVRTEYNEEDHVHAQMNLALKEIDRCCYLVNLSSIAPEAKLLFQTAHREHKFKFGRYAHKWLAASVVLVAEVRCQPINPDQVIKLFFPNADASEHAPQDAKKRYLAARSAVRKSKNVLRHHVEWSEHRPRPPRLTREHFECLLEYLDHVLDPHPISSGSDSEGQAQGDKEPLKFSPPNVEFFTAALKRRTELLDLAVLLLSRFETTSCEDTFIAACFMFCCEALLYKVVPRYYDFLHVVGPFCRGRTKPTASRAEAKSLLHQGVRDRYTQLVKWAAGVYCTLPWISDEQKRLVKQEALQNGHPFDDENDENEMPPTQKPKGQGKAAKQEKNKKPKKGRIGLAMYFKEVIEYEAPRDAHAPPVLVRLTPRDRSRPTHRKELVQQADTAIQSLLHSGAPPNVHNPNVQHFMRLMLAGQTPDELAASASVAHSLVDVDPESASASSIYRARLARLIASRGSVDDLEDDELFMDGELEGIFRTPQEYAEQKRLTASLYEEYDALVAQREEKAAARARKAAVYAEKRATRLAHREQLVKSAPSKRKRRMSDSSDEDADRGRFDGRSLSPVDLDIDFGGFLDHFHEADATADPDTILALQQLVAPV